MTDRAAGPSAIFALAFAGSLILAGITPVLFLGLAGGTAILDPYIHRVVVFTIVQAALSTLISLVIGVPFALALARRRFPGRGAIVSLLSLPLALPAIVAVLGIVGIFGANGILGGAFDLYGLQGILLAHAFFNFPLIARMALSALEGVAAESRRLAAQLGFSDRDTWRHVDRPALLAALPGAALLVFLLCAASFTVILTLGGGPGATTLEVAIYQSLRFDFDPARATLLALAQVVLCGLLTALALRFPMALAETPSLRGQATRYDGISPASKIRDALFIAAGLVVLLPPLAAILAEGLKAPELPASIHKALATSLAIGLAAASLNICLCWPMASFASRSPAGRRLASAAVVSALSLPPAVLATGWFMLLHRFADAAMLAAALVVALNALVSLPFSYAILAPRMASAHAANDRLCASLGLSGFHRLRFIDYPILRRPLGLAFAMAAILSLGDLTAILLFGTQDIVTLPALIYRQMGSYRMEGAAGTALLLALLALSLLTVAGRWSNSRD